MKTFSDHIRIPRFCFQHCKMFENKILVFGVNFQNNPPTYEALVLDIQSCKIQSKTVLLDNKSSLTTFKSDEINMSMASFAQSGKLAVVGIKPTNFSVSISPNMEIGFIASQKMPLSQLNCKHARNYSHPTTFIFGKWEKEEVLYQIMSKEMEYNDKSQIMTIIHAYKNGNIKEPIFTQVIPDVTPNSNNLISWSEVTQSILIYSGYTAQMYLYKENEGRLQLEKKFNCSTGDYGVCEIAPSPTQPIALVTSTRGDTLQIDLTTYKFNSAFLNNDYKGLSSYWTPNGKEIYQNANSMIIQLDASGKINSNEQYKHNTAQSTIWCDNKYIVLCCGELGLITFKI